MDDGILARIDATTDERCACGCGVRLSPDSPSAWFATAACQRRWHGARATDPQDVYRRPDAAPVYVERDSRRVPLTEDTGSPDARPGVRGHRVAYEFMDELHDLAALAGLFTQLAAAPADRPYDRPQPALRDTPALDPRYLDVRFGFGGGPYLTEVEIPGPPDDLPLRPTLLASADSPWSHATRGPYAWQRRCDHHDGYVTPEERMRFRAIWAAADPIPTTMTSTTVLACPVCGTIWPGPIMQAWWRANRLQWGVDLALAAGTKTVHIGVGDDAARHPEMLQYAWAELESSLVERLTDRGRCMWISCTREARRWFRQDRPIPPAHRAWSADGANGSHLRVCHDHYADLLRDPIIGLGVRILLDR